MSAPGILVLHWGTRGGGPQLHVGLARELARTPGVRLALSFDATAESASQLRTLRVPSLVVGSAKRGRARLLRRVASQPVDALRLLRLVRELRIDAVFEVMDNPLQVLPRWLLHARGVPIIASVHDAVRHDGEESRLMDALGRAMFPASDAIMTYSSAVAEELRALRPDALVLESVHPALGMMTSKTRSLPGDRPLRIGFFGRIERYKGLPRLVEAVRQLIGSGRSVELRIVGRGEIDHALRISIDSVGGVIDSRWVPEDGIQDVIDAFDVLALPYNSASQSGVVGFAMNAGVPIVATPVSGLGEQVIAAGGVVAEDMSASAFANAIDSVTGSAERYETASSRGRTAAATTFSWSRLADDVLAAVANLR